MICLLCLFDVQNKRHRCRNFYRTDVITQRVYHIMMLYGLKSTTEKANVTTESVLTFSNKFAEFDETNFDDSSGSEATDMTTQEGMFYCLPVQHLSRDKKNCDARNTLQF